MTDVKRLAAQDDAFGKGGLTFEVSGPVNVAQLDAEIMDAMNWRVPAGIVVDGGRVTEDGLFAPVPADEDRGEDPEPVTATLTVTHDGADQASKEIASVIRAHQPDLAWLPPGLSLDDLVKVSGERLLTAEEITRAVTLLLRERVEG